jgi:hypothetical protein
MLSINTQLKSWLVENNCEWYCPYDFFDDCCHKFGKFGDDFAGLNEAGVVKNNTIDKIAYDEYCSINSFNDEYCDMDEPPNEIITAQNHQQCNLLFALISAYSRKLPIFDFVKLFSKYCAGVRSMRMFDENQKHQFYMFCMKHTHADEYADHEIISRPPIVTKEHYGNMELREHINSAKNPNEQFDNLYNNLKKAKLEDVNKMLEELNKMCVGYGELINFSILLIEKFINNLDYGNVVILNKLTYISDEHTFNPFLCQNIVNFFYSLEPYKTLLKMRKVVIAIINGINAQQKHKPGVNNNARKSGYIDVSSLRKSK